MHFERHVICWCASYQISANHGLGTRTINEKVQDVTGFTLNTEHREMTMK